MQRLTYLLFVSAISLLLVACGGSESSQQADRAPATTSEPATSTPAAAPAAEVPDMVELTIEGNDMMKYDTDRLEVYAGQTVKLTLTHVGQLAKESMGHNWVLLADGVNLEEFALSALDHKDNDYIPTDAGAKVLTHTEMIGGGASTTIEFEAPAAGTYDFLCTFPGHYGFMKGKLVVKKA